MSRHFVLFWPWATWVFARVTRTSIRSIQQCLACRKRRLMLGEASRCGKIYLKCHRRDIPWIGFRENLLVKQSICPIKYGDSCKFPLEPIHWDISNCKPIQRSVQEAESQYKGPIWKRIWQVTRHEISNSQSMWNSNEFSWREAKPCYLTKIPLNWQRRFPFRASPDKPISQ